MSSEAGFEIFLLLIVILIIFLSMAFFIDKWFEKRDKVSVAGNDVFSYRSCQIIADRTIKDNLRNLENIAKLKENNPNDLTEEDIQQIYDNIDVQSQPIVSEVNDSNLLFNIGIPDTVESNV